MAESKSVFLGGGDADRCACNGPPKHQQRFGGHPMPRSFLRKPCKCLGQFLLVEDLHLSIWRGKEDGKLFLFLACLKTGLLLFDQNQKGKK